MNFGWVNLNSPQGKKGIISSLPEITEELFMGWQFGPYRASIACGLNAACVGKTEHAALLKIIL